MKRFIVIIFALCMIFGATVTAVAQTEPVGTSIPVDINGPASSPLGKLCVFSLSDPTLKVGWTIEPEIEFYVDTSKKSIVFATDQPGTYTIIAATVIDDEPVPLKLICHYGIESPHPTPVPKPPPNPNPVPLPPVTLKDWVKDNAPDVEKSDYKKLAEVYEKTVSSLERGTTRTSDAAFSSIRTGTQTAVSTKQWGSFFSILETKVIDEGESPQELMIVFRQIAEAFKELSH